MPHCECGAFVTSGFVRVFSPSDAETVERCLECANREELL